MKLLLVMLIVQGTVKVSENKKNQPLCTRIRLDIASCQRYVQYEQYLKSLLFSFFQMVHFH